MEGGWGVFRGVWEGGWAVKNFFPYPNESFIWAYPENLVKIGLMVKEIVKGVLGAFGGVWGKGGLGVKKNFSHPNELLICAYPEKLVEIIFMV